MKVKTHQIFVTSSCTEIPFQLNEEASEPPQLLIAVMIQSKPRALSRTPQSDMLMSRYTKENKLIASMLGRQIKKALVPVK